MRFRTRYVRFVKRFALFPVKAKYDEHLYSTNEYRWLETVYLHQVKDWRFDIFPYWKNDSFITEEQYNNYTKKGEEK